MNRIIQQRAKQRALDKEKAEQAQKTAEAWMNEEPAAEPVAPSYVPIPSQAPSRASSVFGMDESKYTQDGEGSDPSKSERVALTVSLVRLGRLIRSHRKTI